MFHRLGVRTLIVTNAAGALRLTLRAGAIMLIADHINMPGLIGNNPLIGPNEESLGTRFPDMSTAYDAQYRAIAMREGLKLGIKMHEGVYAAVTGPSYETPAEIRALRTLGADVRAAEHAPLPSIRNKRTGIPSRMIDTSLRVKRPSAPICGTGFQPVRSNRTGWKPVPRAV